MAARTVTSPATITTDILFRAWVTAVYNALIFCGMVQTADSGQINMATVTAPTGTNQNRGYQIFRFNDTLQGTAPVFFKLEYSSFGSSANYWPGWFLTVGQGTDGAGNLTGKVSSRISLDSGNDEGSGVIRNFYQSGDGSFVALCFVRNNGSKGFGSAAVGVSNLFFSIERTKTAAGVDTNEGVLIATHSNVSSNDGYQHQALIFSVVSTQASNSGPIPAIPNAINTAVDQDAVGVFPWMIPGRRGYENPCLGLITYMRNDFPPDAVINVTMYGATHKYMTLGSVTTDQGAARAGTQGGGVSVDAMLAMRYE